MFFLPAGIYYFLPNGGGGGDDPFFISLLGSFVNQPTNLCRFCETGTAVDVHYYSIICCSFTFDGEHFTGRSGADDVGPFLHTLIK